MANRRDKNQDTDPRPGERRREISGPGAADFLTAPGGLDRPETDPEKGTRAAQVDDAAAIGPAPAGLAPQLDEPEGRTERKRETDK
jgi:hypothetical protein